MADTTARIVITAQDKTAGALASLREGMSGLENKALSLRGAFAGLLPAVTLTAGFAFVKTINDGVDALNDLRDATGSSVENISALEDIAARAGVSFNLVTETLTKFNEFLNRAKPGSELEKSLESLGLQAAELRRQDPSEALRQYAVALNRFSDDGNRARLASLQLGESYKQLAPFINDLAKETELSATVTTKQAEEAEKLNKELAALQKNATDAGRAFASVLVPAANRAFEFFRDFGKTSTLASAASDVIRLKNELDSLQARQSTGYFFAGDVSKEIDEVSSKLEEAKKRFRELDEQMRGRSLGAAPAGPDARPSVGPGVDKTSDAAAKKAEEAARKMAEAMQKANEQIFQSTNAEMFASIDAFVEADFKATADLARELADAAKEETRQYYEFKDQQREEYEQKEREAAGMTKESLKELQTIGQDLGFTFSSAFEDAVIGGESFRNVLKGIGDDILRIMLRQQITQPLALALSSMLFSFEDGGVMTSAGPLPLRAYAGGGIASSPQLHHSP